MSLDSATFLRHTPEAEKLTLYTHTEEREESERFEALLIAQIGSQQLFITVEAKRRYVTATRINDEVELAFVSDYEEVEEILEAAGRLGLYNGEQGMLYHNLLFLLLNP